MKEAKTEEPILPTLPAEELVLNGVYFSANKDLVKVKKIDHDKGEFHLFNISEQTTFYIPMKRHNLVRRIR